MKNLFSLLAAVCMYSSALAQGSGHALDLAGTSANEHVNFGNAIMSGLDTVSFTIEIWVNPHTLNADPSILSNKDWDSGNNTGFVLALENGNEFTFNFRPNGGTRRDINIAVPVGLLNQWQHIAVSVDRNGTIKMYRNGVLGATSASIAGDAGLSINGTLALRMGQDGVGDYVAKFDGQTDELRIWNFPRSESEIRDDMCKILNGNESGLVHYYPMNEGTGNQINDIAGNVNGIYQNAPSVFWNLSAAPLGNQAAHIYPSAWSGQSLLLNSPFSGSLLLNNVSGTAQGIHLYRVDSMPNSTTGLTGLAGNSVYFGYFVCGDGFSTADFSYDFNGFSNPAITNPSGLLLFGRNHNADLIWDILAGNLSVPSSTISINQTEVQSEFMLGNIQLQPCNPPSMPGVSAIGYSSASLNWVSGGSGYWNLEYGPSGFTPGSGTNILATNMNPFTLNGLTPATNYEFYVQDTCIANGTSSWVGPFAFTTAPFPGSVGAGTCLMFDGIDDYITCGNSSTLRPTAQITYEAWINPIDFQEEWTGIFTHLQDNSANESGYGMVYYDGLVRAYMTTTSMGANAWNSAPGVAVPFNRWSHIACSYDGSKIRVYLNGLLKDSLSATGQIDWQYLPDDFRIGMFYDDNENVYYHGQVDEIRIWNYARSLEEIRTTMCRKLAGSEQGLLAYYNLNESLGAQAQDLSPNFNDGILTNLLPAAWKISGAAIGDTSTFLYPSSWASQTVYLPSAGQGSLQALLVSANTDGVQIYRVDQMPYYTNGLQTLPSSASYFGTFTAGDAGPFEHQVSFGYGGYTDAIADEANLLLFSRNNASENQWVNYLAQQDLNTDQVYRSNVPSGREYFLGTATGSACPSPAGLSFSSINDSTVQISWMAMGGIIWNYQYGLQGFTPGTGSLVLGSSLNPITLTGLSPNTYYDFYLQDTCAGIGTSAWVGPFSFFTVFCSDPQNLNASNITATDALLNWTGNASQWRIQWGPQGFNLGTGIQVANINTNSYALTGLTPLSNYDYYVRAECGFGNSGYSGPFSFTTTQGSGLVNDQLKKSLLLFPNPADKQLRIDWPYSSIGKYRIFSVNGQEMLFGSLLEKHNTLEVGNLPPGLYQLRVESEEGTFVNLFIKE